MTHLSHLGRSLTYPILALSLLAASSSAFAQDHEYVLLADSVTLADAIHDELQFFFAEVPNDIEIDEQQQALFTEEGERIDFSTIFNQKRLRGSKAVSVVFELLFT